MHSPTGNTIDVKQSTVTDLSTEDPDPLEEHELTIDVEGDGTTNPEPGTYTYEETETVNIESISDDGWELDEWTGDISSEETEIQVEMDGDKQVTAVFTEDPDPTEEFELTVEVDGEGEVEVTDEEDNDIMTVENSDSALIDETTTVTLEATPDADWEFSEWTGYKESDINEIEIEMDGDKQVTAVFTEDPEEYELAVDVEGDGEVTVEWDGESETVEDEDVFYINEDKEVSLEPDAEEDWEFFDWTGDVEDTDEEITLTMDEGKEVTAVFRLIDGNVEIHNLDITPDPADPGETIIIEATVDREWFEAIGWSGEAQLSVDGEVEDQEDVSLPFLTTSQDVEFEISREEPGEYDINIKAISEDDVIEHSISDSFEVEGHLVELATLEGDGAVQVDVGEDGTVDETLESEGDSLTVGDGTQIKFSPDPENNYEFVKWTEDAEGEDRTFTTTIEDDYEMGVEFEEEDPDPDTGLTDTFATDIENGDQDIGFTIAEQSLQSDQPVAINMSEIDQGGNDLRYDEADIILVQDDLGEIDVQKNGNEVNEIIFEPDNEISLDTVIEIEITDIGNSDDHENPGEEYFIEFSRDNFVNTETDDFEVIS